ncbi:glycosyltransferase [Methanosarcina sp.]|jgi:glycosyltransferase involved in cell wall biosynthesis|uniref:glycosyltransferase n=1 Tax=Methanosarcina sp. TaxID=2213 RepID=UPI002B7D4D4C|nr:glycosyltransferase [Methanosarcina sp.]HOW14883.1 glycosyltransferase [Methanosarcina sp.]
MKRFQIHQLHPSVSYGDAIGNEMLEIRTVLRDLGYESNIYGQYIHPKMNTVKQYKEYRKVSSPDNILLMHYSIGYGSELLNFVKSLPDKKILLYHNITPPHFFHNINSDYEYSTKIGLHELKTEIKDIVDVALADSEFNQQDLIDAGFDKTAVLPYLINLDNFNIQPDKKVIAKYDDDFVNILVVGRISPNKKVEDAIKSFYYYTKYINKKSRLLLVGSYNGMEKYYSYLRDLVQKLDLNNVYFTGHINLDELVSYYRVGNVFLAMSEHEGFCVPLLESMYFKIPIIANNSTAIPQTLGGSGILVNEKNYIEIAEMINLLVEDKTLRKKVIDKQTKRLEFFNKKNISGILKNYIDTDFKEIDSRPSIRIEGTFEDSYSLSIINRNLALVLDRLGQNVSLFATTGTGDYVPKKGSIQDKRVRELWENHVNYPFFAIRNIYPPRTKDMNGRYNLIYFFWEESVLPQEWIDDLNSLDGILVPTNFVKDVLINSGINTRIGVIPSGVQVEHFEKDVLPAELHTNKKFLFFNVGSGFPRKGIDVLLKAYAKEFSREDDVCLVVKTFPNIHNNISEQIKSIIKPDGPEVIHIDRDISENELISLYKKCDCYVSPTRGEGFGLTMAEAMLCKVPVITTNYSGQLDFCNENTSYLVDFKLEPSVTHLKQQYTMADSLWAEPDVDHLAALMRHVYEKRNSDEVKAKVEAAYTNIKNNFNWEVSAKKTIEFLKTVQFKPKLGVVSTWNTKCGIAEYTKYLVGNLRNPEEIKIFANKVSSKDLIAMDGENVIRCWEPYFDDLSTLCNKILESDLDIIHVQFNFGFFELSALAKMVKKLKEKGIKLIITFHSVGDTEFMNKPVKLDSIKTELKLVDKIWVHSSNDVRELSEKGIVDNVIKIPHGNVVFDNNEKEELKKGIFKNSKIISTFGFLLPHKGVLETIRALPSIISEYPDVLFLVVSSIFPDEISSKYYESCKKEVAKLGLKDHVIFFTDFLEKQEIIYLLQSSDIVVMPYKDTKEAASGAIRFALASHRPVIVTDIPIFGEFEEEVYKIPSCSPDEIKKGIMKLYENEKLQKEIARSAERKIKEISWPNIANMYENVLLQLGNDSL